MGDVHGVGVYTHIEKYLEYTVKPEKHLTPLCNSFVKGKIISKLRSILSYNERVNV